MCRRKISGLVTAAALLAAGCGLSLPRGVLVDGEAASMAHRYDLPPLWGAEEGKDLEAVEKPPAKEEAPPGRPEPEPREPLGLSAHGGLIIPASAKGASFRPGFVFGVTYDLPFFRGNALSLELAADFGSVSDSGGDITSNMAILSASARYALPVKMLYVAGGASVLFEQVKDKAYDYEGSNMIPLLGVGAGVRPAEGNWDARLAFSILLESENVAGLLALTGGYVF